MNATHTPSLPWPWFLDVPWLRLTCLVTLDLCFANDFILSLYSTNTDEILRFITDPATRSTRSSWPPWIINVLHSLQHLAQGSTCTEGSITPFLIVLPALYNWGRKCKMLRHSLSLRFRILVVIGSILHRNAFAITGTLFVQIIELITL